MRRIVEVRSAAKRSTADRFMERMTIITASSWQKKTRDNACLRRNDVGVPEARATTFLSRVFGNWFIRREPTETRSSRLERESCRLFIPACNSVSVVPAEDII
jgi:hypothetical protein